MSLISIMSREEFETGPDWYWQCKWSESANKTPAPILETVVNALHECGHLYVDSLERREALHYDVIRLATNAVSYFNLDAESDLTSLKAFLISVIKTAFRVNYKLKSIKTIEGESDVFCRVGNPPSKWEQSIGNATQRRAS